jgi:hypothetical protein
MFVTPDPSTSAAVHLTGIVAFDAKAVLGDVIAAVGAVVSTRTIVSLT